MLGKFLLRFGDLVRPNKDLHSGLHVRSVRATNPVAFVAANLAKYLRNLLLKAGIYGAWPGVAILPAASDVPVTRAANSASIAWSYGGT